MTADDAEFWIIHAEENKVKIIADHMIYTI
jgi:hypothetical protein